MRVIFDAFPRTQERLRTGALALGPPLAEDVVWDASEIRLPDLGDGVVHGREGVRRFWMVWLAAWESIDFEYELIEAGEKVVVFIEQRNEGSQVAVPLRYAQIWTFAGGEVVHWKLYNDLGNALEAAGLDPGSASDWQP